MSRPTQAALAGALALFSWWGCATDKPGLAESAETADGETGPLDADGDGHASDADCDDTDADVFPGADERCNAVDDDCDGMVDEEPIDGPTWYVDGDGDGFGADPSSVQSCDAPGRAVGTNGDCDDADATVYPGAVEVCDDQDDDCDGDVDEEAADALACVPDGDGDGYSAEGEPQSCCALEAGWAEPGEEEDCDDDSRAVHPGADELCNLRDDDCDGLVDEDEDGDDTVDSLCDLWGEHSLADADVKIAGNVSDGIGLGASFAPSDVNADGYDDLWVGAHHSTLGGSENSGGVYLVPGPLTESGYTSDLATATLTGVVATGRAGKGVEDAGDVDGDGYPEVWVSVPWDPTTYGGSLYLVQGPVSGTLSLAEADLRWVPGSSDDTLFLTLLGAGDYDADGVPDLVLGASVANGSAGRYTGQAWLLRIDETWGERSLDDAPVNFIHDVAEDRLGAGVAILGSTTGDGSNDLLLTAYGKASVEEAGLVWIVETPPEDGTYVVGDVADATLVGETAGDYTGNQVADLGDISGDGYTDYAVGSEVESTGAYYAGAIYVIYGPTGDRTSLAESDAKLTGVEEKTYMNRVAGNADVDGDGSPDLIVGGFTGIYGSIDGTAYLLRGPLEGGTTSLASADAIFDAETEGDNAGSGLSLAADTNRDGYAEVFIGAFYYDEEVYGGRGAIYQYFGQPF